MLASYGVPGCVCGLSTVDESRGRSADAGAARDDGSSVMTREPTSKGPQEASGPARKAEDKEAVIKLERARLSCSVCTDDERIHLSG